MIYYAKVDIHPIVNDGCDKSQKFNIQMLAEYSKANSSQDVLDTVASELADMLSDNIGDGDFYKEGCYYVEIHMDYTDETEEFDPMLIIKHVEKLKGGIHDCNDRLKFYHLVNNKWFEDGIRDAIVIAKSYKDALYTHPYSAMWNNGWWVQNGLNKYVKNQDTCWTNYPATDVGIHFMGYVDNDFHTQSPKCIFRG